MKKFFQTQPLLKLLSLGMALFLWFFVRAERKLETNLDVNIEITNLPENLVVSREFESVLQVRVIGPASRVEKLKKEHSIAYKLDLGSAKKGANTVWIHEEELSFPYGVRPIQVIPQVIKVFLDRSEEKQVTIVPRFNGNLEYGIEMLGYEVVPQLAKVRGTRDDLSNLQKVYTLPIQLAGRRASFEEQVSLESLDKFVTVSNPTIIVKVNIKENKITKKITKVPVLMVPQSQKWDIVPPEVTVLVSGMAGNVASLENVIEPYVDISKAENLSRESISIQPKIRPKKGVEFRIFPERLTLVKKKRRR